jgi:hypothetical protein
MKGRQKTRVGGLKNDFSEIIGARARLKPGVEAARPAALAGLQPAYCA